MSASRASKRARRKDSAPKGHGLESGPAVGRALKKERAIRFAPEYPLGAGGLCEVFAARDLLCLEHGDGAPLVAVKRLLPEYARDPAALRLLAREFFIARNITHPGVIRVYDLHDEAGALCLSMELLEGRSAYAMLDRYPSGLGAAVYPLARQLFETLAALHHLGIAHGDVKPSNLMLERNNRLVLFDFNTAEAIPRPGRASSPVNPGASVKPSGWRPTACCTPRRSVWRADRRPLPTTFSPPAAPCTNWPKACILLPARTRWRPGART